MKKTTYTAFVYYLTDGEQQKFENLTAENAEAINAQANAGLDLHWFMENEGTMYEFLIPWEAVLSVAINKSTEEVSAPTDTICGGEAESPLVLTLVSPSANCYEATDGVITAFVSTIEDDTRIHQYPNESLSWGYIVQVMFDGVDITEDESVEGTYELTLANGVATYTITVSYQGHTASQSLTASAECSYIGG